MVQCTITLMTKSGLLLISEARCAGRERYRQNDRSETRVGSAVSKRMLTKSRFAAAHADAARVCGRNSRRRVQRHSIIRTRRRPAKRLQVFKAGHWPCLFFLEHGPPRERGDIGQKYIGPEGLEHIAFGSTRGPEKESTCWGGHWVGVTEFAPIDDLLCR